jgi:hypothetical protein
LFFVAVTIAIVQKYSGVLENLSASALMMEAEGLKVLL